jgi:hypothetical protein
MWDEIQRRLNEEQPSPTTAAELTVAFQRVWALIPMAFINRLVNSMYRRCAAVISAGGGPTLINGSVIKASTSCGFALLKHSI